MGAVAETDAQSSVQVKAGCSFEDYIVQPCGPHVAHQTGRIQRKVGEVNALKISFGDRLQKFDVLWNVP